MSAVLRFGGMNNAEATAACSKLIPYRVDRAGVDQAKENALHYLVADDIKSWEEQLLLISKYLNENAADIRSLLSKGKCQFAEIDISVEIEEALAAKFISIPNNLLQFIADLDLGIELSIYKSE